MTVKLCLDCKHMRRDVRSEPCVTCVKTFNKPNWEPREKKKTTLDNNIEKKER